MHCAPLAFALQMVAVYALALFHVWPSEFGNGFLGVDALFVVCGFVLHHQFSHSPSSCCSAVRRLREFYSAQFCRIVPLHVWVVCATLVGALALTFDKELQTALDDSQWALAFATNFQLSFVDWTKELMGLPQTRAFFHVWALSVEVQFLLVFPLFLLALEWLSSRRSRGTAQSLAFAVVLVPSLLCWLFAPSKAVSLGWPCSRLWQFLLGSAASLWAGSPPAALTSPSALPFRAAFSSRGSLLRHLALCATLCSLCLVFFLPSFLWPPFYQSKPLLALWVSASTGALLYSYQRFEMQMLSCAFANWVAAHLGELPFALFLIHQPTAVLLKQHLGVSLLDMNAGLLVLCVVSLGALCVHLSVGQLFRLLRHKSPSSLVLVVIVGYCTGILLGVAPEVMRRSGGQNMDALVPVFDDQEDRVRLLPIDVDSAGVLLEQLEIEGPHRQQLLSELGAGAKVKINEMLKNSFAFDGPSAPGSPTDEFVRNNALEAHNRDVTRIYERILQGNGTRRVLLFGNSHAQVIWKEAHQAMEQTLAEMHVVSLPACMPLFVDDVHTFYGIPCARVVRSLLRSLERTRPDLLVLVFKWYEELQRVPLDRPPDQDPLLAQMRHFLGRAQQFVRDKIFLSAPNLHFGSEIAHQLAKRIWRGAPLDALNKTRTQHNEENRWNYARLAHLRTECPKCAFLDFADHFCFCGAHSADECAPFAPDSQLAYFADSNHLSRLGRLSLRPFLQRALALG